ncbi:MAG TPA: electron transfer flavoprotein beta subunit/FixA family protein, partial [Chloroflexi bacterium]|nr:electron transfer flavoprotein beta subunit/FixA family protein [Chloroflexota bacterium]
MHIVVCMKQVIDPEVPPHLFQIDPVEKKQIRGRQPLVISDYDEVAVEIALQLKEKTDGKVTVVTIGDQESDESLHQALAMGADEAIRVTDPAFETADAFGKAHILAAALRQVGEFDAVLCGRQAGDVELGLVGPFLAEALDLPCATLIANVDPTDGTARLKCPTETGYDILEAPLPFVATVTNDESNVPRYASVRGIMRARKAKIPVWSITDLGLEASQVSPEAAMIQLDGLFIPKREMVCEIITGETSAEKAQNLVLRLKEEQLI